ncbi:amino acid ABC transporter permease [Domibacillus sp. PGB-M46]|uniref:amino acid ABC transporter permease n=1 Tax=Domibacillus sp. PGB-M46 TaxID=2910255 RepID=UPI001F582E96|nr:amino acid ABC transporter permease [Domibacillus sp. PGB-M46]MCI2255793.1 amino acid ABC transporter permease [Domibacillus sp. PGB-M46]
MDINVDLIIDSLPILLKGALVTLQMSLLAIVIGTISGLVLAVFLLSGKKTLIVPTRIFINLLRGIPFIIQIFIVYFSFSNFGLEIPAFTSGVIAMALNTAAFQADIIRAGIESIPKGQHEAAFALGISKRQTMIRILIPQVFVKILPSITNELITLLKNSSLVSVIAVVDLTRVGQQIVSTSYRPAEIYIAVALLYFLMNLAISQGSRYLERKAAAYR